MITAARRCAYDVVRRVFEQGAYADRAFRARADRLGLTGRERALAMRLAYGTVQRSATLDWLIERFTDRPADDLDAPIVAALRLGLYQVAYLEGIADHAAVDESVELAKAGPPGAHGLVNAALRRATREAHAVVGALDDTTPPEAALRHSHPRWLAELWWGLLGPDGARALMERDNEPAESAVRANTLKTTRDELGAALAADGAEAGAGSLAPEALVLRGPYDVHGSPLFASGALMPQSQGSMLVARVVDPRPGERVLDLCAAPGAKTTHLAALMADEGQVVAVELDAGRAATIVDNCERLGVTCVEARPGDAAQETFGGGFDRVLVDPPCSDLGTLQSRPDVRWRKDAAQVEELCGLQRRIIETAARELRPGGRLVYSTCTISGRENEQLIADFLERHRDFTRRDLSDTYPELVWRGSGFVQTLPHRDGTDGFFIAALEKGT